MYREIAARHDWLVQNYRFFEFIKETCQKEFYEVIKSIATDDVGNPREVRWSPKPDSNKNEEVTKKKRVFSKKGTQELNQLTN